MASARPLNEYNDIRTGGSREACKRYCLGRDKMRSVAEDAGAVIKLGRRVLYDFRKLDDYMTSMAK